MVIDSVNVLAMIIGLICLFAGIDGRVPKTIPVGNMIAVSGGVILVLIAAASMFEWF